MRELTLNRLNNLNIISAETNIFVHYEGRVEELTTMSDFMDSRSNEFPKNICKLSIDNISATEVNGKLYVEIKYFEINDEDKKYFVEYKEEGFGHTTLQNVREGAFEMSVSLQEKLAHLEIGETLFCEVGEGKYKTESFKRFS